MRVPKFHVRDSALFEHLRSKGYQVLEPGVFAAIPDEQLRADMTEFANLRRGTLRRGTLDDSRRLRQSEELEKLENQNREPSDLTISTLDQLASALTGGA